MKSFSNIKTILYREGDLKYRVATRILEHAEKHDTEVIAYRDETDLGALLDRLKNERESKELLILKEFHGRKFQKCPGSQNVICCNYYLLNTCFNCLFDCTYCFLNGYLNSYGITQFVNLDELPELMTEHASKTGRIVRIGTGEFTDSLMFDEVTGIAQSLIEKVAPYKNIFLEFKTKSGSVSHLCGIAGKGNTVIAWTLNTPRNINLYEKGTADFNERLDAAVSAQKAGFLTAFHFDPIIKYDEFLEDYNDLINCMGKRLDPERIAWISLGCFRYTQGFKDIIKHKFPGEQLTVEEMFPGIDGKFRYLKSERRDIYSFFYERLKSLFPSAYIYFCMESADVWETVTGINFASSEELEEAIGLSLGKNFL